MTYVWLLAFHIIAIVFWMAGMFMLPRYAIYQAETPPGSPEDGAWVERCLRLRRVILNPAMLLVWALGITLATLGHHWAEGWLGAKLVLVIGLGAYHGWAVGLTKRLARGWRPADTKRLRLLNEVPALALIAIVILAVVKPF